MMIFLVLGAIVFLGVGCQNTDVLINAPVRTVVPVLDERPVVESSTVSPMSTYFATYKRFGEYVSDRFVGYHAGDDLEVLESFTQEDKRVFAMANGEVRSVEWVSGYGGVIVIAHNVNNETVTALYGHINLASTVLKAGDSVSKGDVIATLGDGFTNQTDGERQHLHFALSQGQEPRLAGYVKTKVELQDWINPTDFLRMHGGYPIDGPARLRDLRVATTDFTSLDFMVPGDFDVEYIASIQALNVYRVTGVQPARERSQLLIRFFDATDFLTLSTVTVHSSQPMKIGLGNYDARRYDIEKKDGVADFKDQPTWRNQRHLVTDVRAKEGMTRYFVFAASPELDEGVYEQILSSIELR